MHNLRSFRSFGAPVQLLVVNQLAVNTGFYMLIPFLAMYLTEDLGMSLAVTGIILGARNLSQQGLFLIGGAASDRLGTRPVIIAGCGLRVIGFGLFAIGGHPALLIAGSVIAGLAGALFNPAVRVYVGTAAGDRRSDAFALFNVFAQTGALLGPVVGTLLLTIDFRMVAVSAAGLFLALTVAQQFALPPQPVESSGKPLLADLRRVVGHRGFVLFTLALAGMYALQSQMYLAYPVLLREATHVPQAVLVLFIGTTIASIALQVPITSALNRRMPRNAAITLGMSVMGLAFLPLLWTVNSTFTDATHVIIAGSVIVVSAVAMEVGVMIAQPFILEMIPEFGPTSVSGLLFGTFYLASGLFAAGGNSLIGWGIDYRGGHLGIAICVGLGVGSAIAFAALATRGLVPSTRIDATNSPTNTNTNTKDDECH